MSSLADLVQPQFLVSTGAGAGAVWYVCSVYFKFILRDIAKLEKRCDRLEMRRADDYRGTDD